MDIPYGSIPCSIYLFPDESSYVPLYLLSMVYVSLGVIADFPTFVQYESCMVLPNTFIGKPQSISYPKELYYQKSTQNYKSSSTNTASLITFKFF